MYSKQKINRMAQTKTVVLEPSTNTHTMTDVLEVNEVSNGILKLRTTQKSKVVHGEHGTLGIESEHVMKYVQQELNPVTKKLRAAFD